MIAGARGGLESSDMSDLKQLVFSGVQPTGNLQLGNYLGAIKNWVRLQEAHDCVFCVVDMHALTVNPDPQALQTQILNVAAALLAAGIKPEKHILFQQSQVRQHAELAWVFNCVARMGWLSRMTQFKDKVGKNSEKASVGLFDYPCLMAADILLYRATSVPVGDDQRQHLELTRDIAAKFNNDYAARIAELDLPAEFLPAPEALLPPAAMRIMSLKDGTKKMSKSDPADTSRINLTDDAETIARKIRKAKTDSEPLPHEAEGLKNRPEAENLLNIYAAMTGRSQAQALAECGGLPFSEFKPKLIEALVAELEPINAEYRRYLQNIGYIHEVLVAGSEKAAEKAEQTMKKIRAIVGYAPQP